MTTSCHLTRIDSNVDAVSCVNRRIFFHSKLTSLNLLRSDQSGLSAEQWIHIANITHCYDEYSQQALADQYLTEQLRLPLKMRFKLNPIENLMVTVTASARDLFEKNADFLALPSVDRAVLMEKCIRQVGGLAAAQILFSSKLVQYQEFYRVVESVYGKTVTANTLNVNHLLYQDMVFIKLILSTLMFSTFDCNQYLNRSPLVIRDVRRVLEIQDRYVLLTWKYLLYKHGHEQAVRCFSELIRSLSALNRALAIAFDVDHYTYMFNTILRGTEKLSLTND